MPAPADAAAMVPSLNAKQPHASALNGASPNVASPPKLPHLGKFLQALPDAVWCLTFSPPLPLDLPPDVFVERYFREAVLAHCNEAYARLVGGCMSELQGQPLRDGVELQQAHYAIVRQFHEQGCQLDRALLTAFGQSFCVTQRGFVYQGALESVWGQSSVHLPDGAAWAERASELEDQIVEMGRDLHDGLGQTLTGLRLLAESALQYNPCPHTRALLEQISGLAHRAQEDIRVLGRALGASSPHPFGLAAALKGLSGHVEAAGLVCHVEADPNVPVCSPAAARQLYRIAQEAVQNVLRHAQAQHLWLSLRATPHGLALVVEDDGAGITPEALTAQTGGVGLENMRARAAALEGDFYVAVRPEGGTRVYCGIQVRKAVPPLGEHHAEG